MVPESPFAHVLPCTWYSPCMLTPGSMNPGGTKVALIVWPPPTAMVTLAVPPPSTVPDTVPPVKQGDPLKETVPRNVEPVWLKFALRFPPAEYTLEVQSPVQLPVYPCQTVKYDGGDIALRPKD